MSNEFVVKGFMSYGALVDNADHVVAPLGELSLYAQTFARDRQIFAKGSGGMANTAIRATVFSHKFDGTVYPLPVEYGQFMAEMGAWIYTEYNNAAFTSDPNVFVNALQNHYTGSISNVVVGPLLQDGMLYHPQWVSFKVVPSAVLNLTPMTPELTDSEIKIWFSDAAFVSQYDEYEFFFIPPIDNLDDFYLNRTAIENLVKSRTQTQTFDLITQHAGGDPYTGAINQMYQYHDPMDPLYRLDTNWVIVYYGGAANNVDIIQEELSKWILDNSTHDIDDWQVIFPDIFKSTEFIISPLWTHYGIPNKTHDPGMYSPTVLLPYGLDVVHKTCVGQNYTQTHVDANTSVMNITYKSLAALITGGPDNRGGISQFYEIFEDYLAVPTSSVDFDRMSPITQGFVHLLHELLFVAEAMTPSSQIPNGMTRLTRMSGADPVMYIVKSYNNIKYLVVAKTTMNDYFPPAIIPSLQLTYNGLPGVTTMDPAALIGPYTQIFAAIGGTGPYKYTLVGTQPPEVANWYIDPVTGGFTATFAFTGHIEVKVQVVDANQRVRQAVFDLDIV